MNATSLSTALISAAIGLAASGTLWAADIQADDGKNMVLGEGRFELAVPEKWNRKKPKVKFIEYEYEVPAAEGDERPGRVTAMGAGGTVEENVNRWYGQFRQPDETETSKSAKVEQKKVAGQDVTVVDVSGTYIDRPAGPFAPGESVERENYRMLAAIIETSKNGKKTGNYFIKLVGPKQTIADNKKAFDKMIESLKEK